MFKAPREGVERSVSCMHSSECKQNVSTCELQWVLQCSRRETLAFEGWWVGRIRILSWSTDYLTLVLSSSFRLIFMG